MILNGIPSLSDFKKGGWGLALGSWGREGEGGQYRVTSRTEKKGGQFFLSLQALGKKGNEARVKQREREAQTNRGEMDDCGGEGLEQERCLLVGCGPRSGWIDFARVELHHLPCISLFFSQPGEVDSLRRAQEIFCFLDYQKRRVKRIYIHKKIYIYKPFQMRWVPCRWYVDVLFVAPHTVRCKSKREEN